MAKKRLPRRHWIPRDKGLHTKREVVAMAHLLKITGNISLDCSIVADKCCQVWDWFDTESSDGRLRNVALLSLDCLTSVAGFGSAMVAVGWMLETADGLVMPNFERHLGESAKKRLVRSYQRGITRITESTLSPQKGDKVIHDGAPTERETERERENTPSPTPSPTSDNFALTPEGLATAWVFYLARRRNRGPADDPADVSPVLAELVKLGHAPAALLAEIERPGRDRSEHLWQFKKRLESKASDPVAEHRRRVEEVTRRAREGQQP